MPKGLIYRNGADPRVHAKWRAAYKCADHIVQSGAAFRHMGHQAMRAVSLPANDQLVQCASSLVNEPIDKAQFYLASPLLDAFKKSIGGSHVLRTLWDSLWDNLCHFHCTESLINEYNVM